MPENTYNIQTQGLGDYPDSTRLNTPLEDLINSTKAMLGADILLVCDPATLGSSAAAVATAIAGDGFSRVVAITLVDSDGNRIFSDGTFAVAVVATTAGDGAANILDSETTIDLVNGVGSVTIEYTATWAEADTAALTVTGGTVAGVTVANKTSVDTLIA